MRKAHMLKGNKRNEQPQTCIWVDTETSPETYDVTTDKHVLTFGWAAFRRRHRKHRWGRAKWLRFTTRTQFWDWADKLCRPNSKLYMFAHNVGFDAPVLGAFTELPERGWELENAIIEGPPTVLTWKWRHKVWRKPFKPGTWRLRSPRVRALRTLVWIDTLNIWPMPLRMIGHAIGLEKLEMPSPDASPDEWDAYGKRDTEIIMAACVRWWEWLREHDLGGFSPTIAAQAFRAYRHRFMPPGILIDSNETALEMARDALHGGRTECHRIGEVEGPVHVMDVNAQYPDIMHSRKMPMYLRGVYKHVSIEELRKWAGESCVIAEVSLETDAPVYGVVHDKRLCFPVGRLHTTLTTPEVNNALMQDHVTQVHRVAVYVSGVIFMDYVEYFQELRLKAKVADNAMDDLSAKKMQNALFGKFGQRGRVYEGVGECEEHVALNWVHLDANTNESSNMRALGGLVQQWTPEGESSESHPAIAAHITAYGRMNLWGLMVKAGGQNVYYTDTDSLMVNEAGYRALRTRINPTRLGALKLEGTHPRAHFRGPKDYVLGDVEKIKGVRGTAGQIGPDSYYQTKFTGLKGLVRSGSVDAPLVGISQKTLRREYKKGVVQPNGRVLPLRLDQW